MEMDAQTSKDVVANQTDKNNWTEKVIPVRVKPYLYCTFFSLCIAGFSIISKFGLDKGMSLYVLVAYSCIVASPTTAILAILFERKNKCKLSFPICIRIFILGVSQIFGRIFYYAGMQCTSATFAGAMLNLVPPLTFVLATICRMEEVKMLELSGQAKVAGTIMAFVGATLMTLYKGITVIKGHNHHNHGSSRDLLEYGNLIKGSLFIILQCCLLTLSYILQASTIKRYPAPLTLTTLTILSGTPVAVAIAAVLDHNPSSWRLGFDVTLVAPLYCGVMVYGIAIYVNNLVIPVRGPVFAAAFNPLITIFIAVMGLLILHESLYLGGIVGSILIIIGLYAVLWGQEQEENKKMISEPPVVCP